MNKKGKTQRGITLIALVITIIVMLILVGVTISMAVNGGLFDYAGEAVKGTNDKLREEGQLAEGGIEVDGEWYSSINDYLNKDKERISKEKSYIGCYADVDGNGTVDGVIYADLAIGVENGSWGGQSYSYAAETDLTSLKDYYVSGTYEGEFSEEAEEVLTVIGDRTKKDRFYVMALEDLTTADYTSFIWYKNAGGNMSDYATATSTAFGAGKANTKKIKGYWDAQTPYGNQYTRDLWAQISITSNWFVPSKEELVAFAGAIGASGGYDESYERIYFSRA